MQKSTKFFMGKKKLILTLEILEIRMDFGEQQKIVSGDISRK